MGCIEYINIIGIISSALPLITVSLSIGLPYWVLINKDFTTTLYNFEDRNTKVTYNYGFWTYCLDMSRRYLVVSTCESRERFGWETSALWLLIATSIVGVVTLLFSVFVVWRKATSYRIITTVSAFISGILATCAVLSYQTNVASASVEIAGLITDELTTEYLSHSYQLATVGVVSFIICGVLNILAMVVYSSPTAVEPLDT